MISVIEFLNRKGFEWKEQRGQAVMNCPFCQDKEKKFAIGLANGAYSCLHLNTCGVKGSFWDFQEKMGDKPQSLYRSNVLLGVKKTYVRPKTTIGAVVDPIITYLAGRKLSRSTAEHFGIGSKDAKTIMFPYRRDGELINVKYRNIRDKKTMWTESGAEGILFNHDLVGQNERMLVICEGEYDAMALFEYGIEAASVPMGASNFQWVDNEWEFLTRFKKIYLCFDNDPAGQKALYSLVQKLGGWRCYQVILPAKDANDALKAGVAPETIMGCFEDALDFRPNYLATPMQFADEVLELFKNNPELNGSPTAWPWLTKILRGWRNEELTVWSGKNGSGKSTILNQHLLDLASKDIRTCIASLELPAKRYLRWAVIQQLEKTFPAVSEIKEVLEFLEGKVYIVNSYEELIPEEIFEVFEYAARRYDVKHFIVDSLSRVKLPGVDDLKEEKKFVSDLLTFSKKFCCHVHLVAHPRKTNKDNERTGKVDIKGSGAITDLAHNVLITYRPDEEEKEASKKPLPDMALMVKKNREFGTEGSIGMSFNPATKKFYEIKPAPRTPGEEG
jgi:twinkle protein